MQISVPRVEGDLGTPGSRDGIHRTHWRRILRGIYPLTWKETIPVAVLSLIFCPLDVRLPEEGLDPSWMLGLSWAHELGLQFGPDIDFTFGPWGFAITPVALSRGLVVTALAAMLFLMFATLTLLRHLTRRAGPWISWVGIAVIAYRLTPSDLNWLPCLLLGVALIAASRWRARDAVLVAALAAMSGWMVLWKVNFGLATAAIAVIVIFAVARRDLWLWLVGLGGFTGGLVITDLIVGQSPADLPDYLAATFQFALGFTTAMSVETPIDWVIPTVVALIASVAFVVFSWVVGRTKLDRVALFLALLVVAVTQYSSGLGRADPGHISTYILVPIITLVIITCMVTAAWSQTLVLRRAAVIYGCVVLVVTTAYGSTLTGKAASLPTASEHFQARIATMATPLEYLVSPTSLTMALSQRQSQMREAYQLAPELVEVMKGRRVSVDPEEVGIAWSNDLAWHPVPVFQLYAAYTASLDQRNAAALVSDSGPDTVLRRIPSVSELKAGWRSPSVWQSPRYQVTLRCNFQPVSAKNSYEVLFRAEDRCGPRETLWSGGVRAGEEVQVPVLSGPGMIIVDIEAQQSALTRLLRSYATGTNARLRVRCNGGQWLRIQQGSPSGPLILADSGSGLKQAGPTKRCDSIMLNQEGRLSFTAIPYLS